MAIPEAPDTMIENRTFDEIVIGDSASVSRTVSQRDIDLFAVVSGDVNPAHMDPAYAETDMFHKVIAHGMIGAGLISNVLGTKLPGPGTIYLGQDLRFLYPVSIGDTITATLTVAEKRPEKGNLVLQCRCVNQNGETVITGTAHVRAPTEKVRRPRIELPEVQVSRHERFRTLLARAAGGEPVSTAVAHPCDASALGAATEAARAGLIRPILVGPKSKIIRAAERAGADIAAFRLIDVPHSDAAATEAVALVRRGEASLLMKGSLHTDELLRAVLAADSGLRTERWISHVYLMDVPSYPRPLLFTDAVDQHCSRSGAEARHRAERHRPGACHGHRDATCGDSVGGRNGKREAALDAGCRRALQDGRPRTDHRRTGGRAAGLRQCCQPGGGGDKRDHFRGCGASRYPRRARSRGRQHAGQATDLHGRCRRSGHRPGRPGAHHPYQSCRLGADPDCVLRRGGADRPRPDSDDARSMLTCHDPVTDAADFVCRT